MSIEAARKAVQGEVLSTDEIEEIIAAFVGDDVLYAEPARCLHRTLMYVHGADICSDCGAAQRWVVQVFPEVTDD